MDQINGTQCHNVILKDRRVLNLSGVCEILSFDENSVTVDISDYILTVDGTSLKIESFCNTTGDTVINGIIDAISYNEKSHKVYRKGFFAGLFKNDAE